ncbi:MAG: hypothetical protein Q8P41_27300 [Pseudomonadota bacterium]|nr:hypothetical protein [Pseudomonadota bacterium]
MHALAFAGSLLALLCAGAGGMQITGSFTGALLFGGLLGWAWYARERVPGVQGRTTMVAALASGVLGVSDTFTDIAANLRPEERDGLEVILAAGFLVMLVALGMFGWACRALAIGKGRSQWLGLLGFFNVIGYAVVVFLPPAQVDTASAPSV